ncbi:MAG: biopolymer transporter ExbD [Deltaproteobacteria bacterium]|nr:biopolymer transporter ExbD [Deltaproteobacteria bacterium]
MPFYRSIRQRRSQKKLSYFFDLQLTSMLDIFIVVLIFLLKIYAVSTNSFSTVNGIKLPYSFSLDTPPDTLQVIITPEGLTFENNRIIDFIQTASEAGSSNSVYTFKTSDLDEGGRRIVALYDALLKAKEKSELLRLKSKARDEKGKPLPFEGFLAIQADKSVRYDIIRKIMYTAATADFKTFRFLALKHEE